MELYAKSHSLLYHTGAYPTGEAFLVGVFLL